MLPMGVGGYVTLQNTGEFELPLGLRKLCEGRRQEREDKRRQGEKCHAGFYSGIQSLWMAQLVNNMTLTLGMQNVFDENPPFVAGSFENGY